MGEVTGSALSSARPCQVLQAARKSAPHRADTLLPLEKGLSTCPYGRDRGSYDLVTVHVLQLGKRVEATRKGDLLEESMLLEMQKQGSIFEEG